MQAENINVYGLIIYEDTGSMPQDVIFIPCKKCDVKNSDIGKSLHCALTENGNLVPAIYFQGLRWRNPRVYEDLKEEKGDSGIIRERKPLYFGLDAKVVITKGGFTFDKSRGARLKPENELIVETELVFKDSLYQLLVTNDMSDLGFSIKFLKMKESSLSN